MRIRFENCNNIDDGEIEIKPSTLNVKYAINGTGKSTLARAIRRKAEGDEGLVELLPYKYFKNTEGHKPKVEMDTQLQKVCIFDEEYLEQYIFQEKELLKGSFDVFVKTRDYDIQMAKIRQIVKTVSDAFSDDADLSALIEEFEAFVKGCGNARSGYAENGAIAKGVAKGNKIDNIPEGLEAYEPYLHGETNLEWLEWCLKGVRYSENVDVCPFCTSPLEPVRAKIVKVAETYNTGELKNFNKMAAVFHSLEKYFSTDTKCKIEEILRRADAITPQQKQFVATIRQEAEGLRDTLNELKFLSYMSLKDERDIARKINDMKINVNLLNHFNSEEFKQKAEGLNRSLDVVLQAVNNLREEVARQRNLIGKLVETNQNAINEFLLTGGYPYSVKLEPQDDGTYNLVLRHSDLEDSNVTQVKARLSYGERNALALALFMFGAIKDDADLIVLDDPISSFDGNKKFAILDLLFLRKTGVCLKNRTVLMLTHDFAPVIDVVKTMRKHFYPEPMACFVGNADGHLFEKQILPDDILCSIQIAKKNVDEATQSVLKLIHLRRLVELKGETGSDAYNMLSSLLHKRPIPTCEAGAGAPAMSDEEKAHAAMEIALHLHGFSYDDEYAKVTDRAALISLYNSGISPYEKLQVFRLLFENNEGGLDDISKKFVNEAYHIENDYLFQLDPAKFDTVPGFVIKKLDAVVNQPSPAVP